VLFVFELSEVEVRCTKDQSEEILEHIIDRRLSAVKADENPGDIQFRGVQPPLAQNRIGFSASQSIPLSVEGRLYLSADAVTGASDRENVFPVPQQMRDLRGRLVRQTVCHPKP
jgi:hypothetical protein